MTDQTHPQDLTVETFTKSLDETKFKFAGQKVLLTYKHHLNKTWLRDELKKITNGQITSEYKFFRAAHEGEDTETKYDHTHVVIDFGKRFQSTNNRVFDIITNINGIDETIHPNIRPITSAKHFNNAKAYLAKEDPENEDLIQVDYRESNKALITTMQQCPTTNDALAIYMDCFSGKIGSHTGPKINDISGIIKLREIQTSTMPNWIANIDKLHPWQEKLYERIKPTIYAPERTIVWYYDPKGGAGKTCFTQYLRKIHQREYIRVTAGGKTSDLVHVIRNELQAGWTGHCMFLDLSRSRDENVSKADGTYDFIESIKNGEITTTKYNGCNIFIPKRPHVIVLANCLPYPQKLSVDRWVIYEITDTLDEKYIHWSHIENGKKLTPYEIGLKHKDEPNFVNCDLDELVQ